MGTVLGVPTRRYHALLVAALEPPASRIVALHSLDERVTLDRGSAAERAINLTRFQFAGGDAPTTHPNLLSFERGPWCLWRYMVDGVLIEKRLLMPHGRNAVEIRYTIRAPGRRVRLQTRPLLALRDFHSLRRRPGDAPPQHVFQTRHVDMGVVTVADHHGVVLTSDAPRFRDDPAWWTNLYYRVEHDRGQDHVEDLYTPGEFILESQGLDHDATLTVYATIDTVPTSPVENDLLTRSRRLHAMADAACGPGLIPPADRDAIERLCAAADEFVVPRGGSALDPLGRPGRSILAGYPWFVDWGRDAMISLPGLLNTTGRYDDAAAVLRTFAAHLKNGIIPNRFDDRGGAPHYNTADASLWFVHAVHELWQATASLDDALTHACAQIIDAYRHGTRAGGDVGLDAPAPTPQALRTLPGHQAPPETSATHAPGDLSDAPGGSIAMDPADGLIAAGDERTQLTWMDARRDGISFTPRAGKAVEINALWHHALRSTAAMLKASSPREARELESLADRVAASFRLLFWNADAGCLYDLVPDPARSLRGQPAAQIRPNQVIAASLPTSPLTEPQRAGVLEVIRHRLLTPVGLRTLDPADPGFQPTYSGPLRLRDRAYHNGTVWPWLQGPYVEATLRHAAFSSESRRAGRHLLAPLLDQMTRHCPGHLPEVYDGQTPSFREGMKPASISPRPDGCPAQAWSIAMTLRALSLCLTTQRGD